VETPPTSVPIIIHDTPVNFRDLPATEKSSADVILAPALTARNEIKAKTRINVICNRVISSHNELRAYISMYNHGAGS
jgi:hypothetical protein